MMEFLTFASSSWTAFGVALLFALILFTLVNLVVENICEAVKSFGKREK